MTYNTDITMILDFNKLYRGKEVEQYKQCIICNENLIPKKTYSVGYQEWFIDCDKCKVSLKFSNLGDINKTPTYFLWRVKYSAGKDISFYSNEKNEFTNFPVDLNTFLNNIEKKLILM